MRTNTKILANDFHYLASEDRQEVLTWLAEHGEQSKILAGGTDLLTKMKTTPTKFKYKYLINVMKLKGLAHITEKKNSIKIGSLTTLREVEQNEKIKTNYSALYEAVRSMAASAVKNMATIGGNLCNGSPAADTAPALLVFDGKVVLEKQSTQRLVPLKKFFLGPGETVVSPDELLTEIQLPALGSTSGSSFLKLGRVAADIAKINVAVQLEREGNRIVNCRIAFGSVAPIPLRLPEVERLLTDQEFTSELIAQGGAMVPELIQPITDNRSTSNYRKKVSRVIFEEALKAAWLRSGGAR